MHTHLPLPVVQAFLVCEEIAKDSSTGGWMLRIPPPAIIPSHYPAVIGISVFIQLRDMRGTCRIGLQLHDPTDEVIWREIFPEEIVCPNPLGVHYHIVQKWPLRFPKPGHYVLGLILNGEEVSRHHWDLMRSPEK